MPDAQPSSPLPQQTRVDLSERVALLELDVHWMKETTNKNIHGINSKLDRLVALMSDLPASLKKEIKEDLSQEFERLFVPKRALYIAMGVSLALGFLGGNAVPLLKVALG